MNIVMTIIFIALLAFTLCLYTLSKGKYDEYLEPLDKDEYKSKAYFPIGFYLLDKLNYKYSSKYDSKLLTHFAEISGHKFAYYYLKVHYASKIILMLLLLILIALFGMILTPNIEFFAYSLGFLALVFFLTDKKIKEKVENRRLSIRIDFPDFLNKLTLLINAGMTISKAWDKIVSDNKKERPLYLELAVTLAGIKSGTPEHIAYEDFSKRCRIPEVTKFTSIVVQNLRKGSSDMVSMLRILSGESWESRKNAAKRLGEEASTKLLLPMMIMFVAILIIVAVPAMLALSGI